MIHDWEIFSAVLAIGIGLTVLVIYAGYLATLSLHPSKRPGHYVKLGVVGIALMLLIGFLGLLVDRSQSTSRHDAEEALSRLATVQAQLAASHASLQDVHESIAQLQLDSARVPRSSSPGNADSARSLDAKLAAIQHRLLNAEETIPRTIEPASAAPPNPEPQVIPSPSPPLVEETKTAPAPEKDSRKPTLGELHGLVAQVKKLDVERQSTLIKIGEDFSSSYRNGNIPYQLPPTVQSLIAREDSQDTSRYVNLIPSILKARREALVRLQMTPQQAAEDATHFEEANKLAASPSPVSQGSLGMYVNTKRFGPISAYLQGLDQLTSN